MTEQNLAQMEEQLAQLRDAIAAKRAESGADAAAPYEREEVHAALGEQMSAAAPAPQQAPAPTAGDVPSWQDPALAGTVQQLVQVAFTQGVGAAVQQAVASGNAALVDALHDILADELHAELLARQKVAPAA